MAKKQAPRLKPRGSDGVTTDELDDLDEGGQYNLPTKQAKSKDKKSKTKSPKSASARPSKIGGLDYEGPRLHDYDAVDGKPRKLTKKQVKSLEEWKGSQSGKKRDSYFIGLAEAAKKKWGHTSVLAGNELNSLVVGIPMPSLALEWLIENDVFPLSLIVLICGRWGSCKSALLYEIFRWFAKFGGGSILQENETKFSEDLCTSIMGIDVKDPSCPLIVNRCHSVEDWQKRNTWFIADQKKRMIGSKEEPGPGRTIPVCFAIDSVMGKSSEEKQEKIQEKGSAERGGPVEALKISEYLAGVSHLFDNWPFSLVLVNHLKDAVNIGGDSNEEESMAGGKRMRFQESFEIRTRVWRRKIETADFDGIGIRLECDKNSFGVTGRRIRTRMLWWDEPTDETHPRTGQPMYERRTVWDWDWATITMLNDLPNKAKARLKEADFHLEVRSPAADVECMARSKTLGMGKEDWLPFHEVGAMIRDNPEVTERIRTALSIKRRALLKGDYLQQIEDLKKHLT